MIAYLSHPLGDLFEDLQKKQDNLANAGAWLRFLIQGTSWAVVAPWYLYQLHVSEEQKPRMLADQLRVVSRCDVVVFCGHWSPHMRYEQAQATRAGIKLLDLTDLGYTPPTMEARALITARLPG